MPIATQQLLLILPNARPVAGVFVPALQTAMLKFGITTPLRKAAFLAQVGHESAHLTATVENLNYSASALQKTWPSRFPAALAAQVERKPEQIANIAYGLRMGNGPTASGDGWKYRGRGLIQITGWVNYQACGAALDLLNKPELLEQPIYAALSAAWFWQSKGLNALADAGDLARITQRINGGQNGAADRAELYARALDVLA